MIFVVAMLVILTFELVTGRAVSSYTRGSDSGTRTSIPGLGHHKSSTTPTPTPVGRPVRHPVVVADGGGVVLAEQHADAERVRVADRDAHAHRDADDHRPHADAHPHGGDDAHAGDRRDHADPGADPGRLTAVPRDPGAAGTGVNEAAPASGRRPDTPVRRPRHTRTRPVKRA